MMDATDAWPQVQATRAWVLDRAALPTGSLVVDVGSGPGTFSAAARARGARALDIDRSAVMVDALVARHPGAVAARADVEHLPLRGAAADLVHIERVLQWTARPAAALIELGRVTAPGGFVAITDTDWATLAIDHPDPEGAARVAAAARRWVAHPTLARSLPRRLADAGATDVVVRTDVVTILAWDPDDPGQHAGPPGLPLRTMAGAAVASERAVTEADVDTLADHARHGRFFAAVTLVSVVARRTRIG